MSIIFQSNDCILVNHRSKIIELYKNTSENGKSHCYEMTGKLFSIKINKLLQGNRKRPYKSDKLHNEVLKIKEYYDIFVQEIPVHIKDSLQKIPELETSEVRDLAKKFFETITFDHSGLNGGNSSANSIKCRINNDYYLIPPKSRFFCGNIKKQCTKLTGNKYDIVIADPPWWNKYIRRLKSANDKLSYSMMYNEDIAAIPIKDLLSTNCLVAVWCTNAPSNIDAVKNIIFPSWGVSYITTWYWLKVTTNLEPMCEFSCGSKKQPFERLMIGAVGNVEVPHMRLIVSVPSALHSHKPPLLDILKPYLDNSNPKILELFARYLLPNTTSVGYEPLKWQHISLYDQVSSKNSL